MKPATKNLLMGGAAVVLLVAAGVITFTRGLSAKAKYPTGYTVQGVDLVTKEELVIQATNDESAPFTNPKTGQRTVYPWHYCPKCNRRFVPQPVPARQGGPPKMPMIPACPGCGGPGQVWVPEDPEQAQPAGDLPLPAMPK